MARFPLRLVSLEDRLNPVTPEFVATLHGSVSNLMVDSVYVWWSEENTVRRVTKDHPGTITFIDTPGVRDFTIDELYVYYVDGNSLWRANQSTGKRTVLSNSFGNPSNGLGGHPSYVTIDSGPQAALYVTTGSTLDRTVYRVDKLNGTTSRLDVPFFAEDIAAGGNRLAWVEPSRGRVEEAISQQLAGTPNLLYDAASNGQPTGGSGPQTIAVDFNGVYWVEGSGAVRTVRGGSLQNLASGSGGAHGSGLAVDNGGDGNVFFVNGSAIDFVPKTGGPVRNLISGVNPVFLAADGNYLYWTTGSVIQKTPKPQAAYFPPPGPALSPNPASKDIRATAADAGGAPVVTLVNQGKVVLQFPAFDPSFTGGVRVALADVDGDGTPDVIEVPGSGGPPVVRMFNGKDGSLIREFTVFEDSFRGGLFVTAGDLDGDGIPEIVVSPDQGGGPRVRVLRPDGSSLADFFGIEDTAFRGGARVAIGDLNGDGFGDLIVAAGFGGGPRIAGFEGKSVVANNPVKLFGDFFVFEQTLRNGVFVASGDLNGDRFADIVVGGGPGGGPRVFAISGKDLTQSGTTTVLLNQFAGDSSARGGVHVATADADGDGKADVITGPGPGSPSQVFVISGANGTLLDNYLAIPGNFNGGVFVAGK